NSYRLILAIYSIFGLTKFLTLTINNSILLGKLVLCLVQSFLQTFRSLLIPINIHCLWRYYWFCRIYLLLARGYLHALATWLALRRWCTPMRWLTRVWYTRC